MKKGKVQSEVPELDSGLKPPPREALGETVSTELEHKHPAIDPQEFNQPESSSLNDCRSTEAFAAELGSCVASAVSGSSHNRTGTTVVKELTQSYQFTSALEDFLSDEFTPPTPVADVNHSSKSRIAYEELVVPRQPKELQQTNRGRSTCEFFPSKIHCIECRQDVQTVVKFQAPQPSFWQRLFCTACVCSNQETVLLHFCPRYYLVLDQFVFRSDPGDFYL